MDWLISSSCTLCGTKMSEDHILNCRQTHLYRVMRHDAIVCWLHDHIATRKKRTVTHEQKTWVEHASANQKPDLFLPDTNQAIDVGLVQPKSVARYYKAKMQACGARTMPIILGTNGVLHEKSKKHLQDFGVDIPRFMAYAVFIIEYQHHKTTADYMTGPAEAGTAGRQSPCHARKPLAVLQSLNAQEAEGSVILVTLIASCASREASRHSAPGPALSHALILTLLLGA